MMGRPEQKAAGESAQDPIVLAAIASVGLSWYQFFIRGNRTQGIFIGLWPPTLLAFASYFNQKRMEKRMNPTNMMDSVRKKLRSK
nr:hypothetical protein [Haladaptatus pallidirubidus]